LKSYVGEYAGTALHGDLLVEVDEDQPERALNVTILARASKIFGVALELLLAQEV